MEFVNEPTEGIHDAVWDLAYNSLDVPNAGDDDGDMLELYNAPDDDPRETAAHIYDMGVDVNDRQLLLSIDGQNLSRQELADRLKPLVLACHELWPLLRVYSVM